MNFNLNHSLKACAIAG